jgi:hypothetical protein
LAANPWKPAARGVLRRLTRAQEYAGKRVEWSMVSLAQPSCHSGARKCERGGREMAIANSRELTQLCLCCY